MNIFTDTGRHDRLSLIYRPFTIEEEEVTFSEEEDVSAEKDCLSTLEVLLCCRTEKMPAKEGGREENVRAGRTRR
ncbi:hypothetical protein GBF38_006200 [Nibea albiflora]|uniref:Uncharacterized protein n=1 Tax=Nibea albiflora TaxID=240163 RepID=A0ACB7FB76_NIBAL|nr:hypothetical protein GBF38_006200 [Nibea albiflora]